MSLTLAVSITGGCSCGIVAEVTCKSRLQVSIASLDCKSRLQVSITDGGLASESIVSAQTLAPILIGWRSVAASAISITFSSAIAASQILNQAGRSSA
jgi:hypothetical protein